MDPVTRAMLLNNTTWAGLLDGQTHRLAEFTRNLDTALRTLPVRMALLWTRAACAIAGREVEHRKRLIGQAMRLDTDGAYRAIHAAWLAAAATQENDAEAAPQYAKAAKRLAADSHEVAAILHPCAVWPGHETQKA